MVGFEKLNGRPGSQVRAADANDDKHIGILLNPLGRGLNAGELLLVIVLGQSGPA